MQLWANMATVGGDWMVLFEGNNMLRLLLGLWVSVRIALISLGISLVAGTLLGVVMNSRSRIVQLVTKFFVEFMRLMPQIVLLFLVYFETTKVWSINISAEFAAIVVFSLWGTAELGDLVRGAIAAIPRIQYDSAAALGMSRWQTQRYVVIPQAVRQLIPTTVNLTTRMIKTTALVYLIGVVEVLWVAKQIIDANRFDYPNASLWVYLTVFALYFVVCFAISQLSRVLERKLAL